MTNDKKIYLSKNDSKKLLKYCKGCIYFQPELQPKSICTLVGWYNTFNIEEIIEYVKECPCNKKCLVKAACNEEECPIWKEYVYKAIKKRSEKMLEEKWKKKNSRATNA